MGRPAHPWFRKARKRWYAKIGGKMVDLGEDQRKAFELFERLVAMASNPMGKPADTMASNPMATGIKPGTVAELIPLYLRQLDVKPKTKYDSRNRLNWFAKRFGSVEVAKLDPLAVDEEIRATGWKPNTRRQSANVIGAFVRWCGRSQFRLKRPPVESRGEKSIITPDEIAKLIAAATGDFAALLRVLWLCGCRPSEARNMTAENVNWSAGVVVLREHKLSRKTSKPRLIHLSDEALAVIEQQRAIHRSGYLFRSSWDGGQIREWEAYRLMRRARKKAGVRKEVTAYFTRHTYATRLLEAGVPDSDVAALLGHSGTAMLHQCYSHVAANARRLREVAGKVAG